MSSNTTSPRPVDDVKHSDPIPINQTRSRARSVSSASSGSASSGYDLPTPISGSLGSNSIRTSIPSPTSSPIFSYFMSSPTKATTFPLRRKFPGTTPVVEGWFHSLNFVTTSAHSIIQRMKMPRGRSRLLCICVVRARRSRVVSPSLKVTPYPSHTLRGALVFFEDSL